MEKEHSGQRGTRQAKALWLSFPGVHRCLLHPGPAGGTKYIPRNHRMSLLSLELGLFLPGRAAAEESGIFNYRHPV